VGAILRFVRRRVTGVAGQMCVSLRDSLSSLAARPVLRLLVVRLTGVFGVDRPRSVHLQCLARRGPQRARLRALAGSRGQPADKRVGAQSESTRAARL